MQKISVIEEIERFIGYFKHKYQIIKNTNFEESGELFKKIIYIAMIDALAKTVFPKCNNRMRFVKFIKNFSDWNNCKKISLPHLGRLIDLTPEPEYEEVRKFIASQYDQWVPTYIISLDKDPDYEKVLKYWPKEKIDNKIIKVSNLKLESIQHAHLLYSYRNVLVHELRILGYGAEELSLKQEPSYHFMNTLNGETTWELVYPLGFFEKICESCIDKLYKHLIKNKINPYQFFAFGSYWLDELNE